LKDAKGMVTSAINMSSRYLIQRPIESIDIYDSESNKGNIESKPSGYIKFLLEL